MIGQECNNKDCGYYSAQGCRNTREDCPDDYAHLSNCCCAPIYEDSDICSECKEHCATMEEE